MYAHIFAREYGWTRDDSYGLHITERDAFIKCISDDKKAEREAIEKARSGRK